MKRWIYILFIGILFLFGNQWVGATTGGIVEVEDSVLRVRQAIDGLIVERLTTGTNVIVLDTNAGTGNKDICSGVWYKIEYGNFDSVGYACGEYIRLVNEENDNTNSEIVTTYNRPWTSPKKSIVGGAEFIANNYISKGQYTSYLKKFNVNPDSYYNIYNHQYMANLRAPSSEAYNSYNSYLLNGLLSLPLQFSIPIYDNMPDYTNLPLGEVNTLGQTEVTDEVFEVALDAQGFDESYKKKLRLLHNSYPNWSFIAMDTGLDFSASVRAEQAVSSISGNSIYYEIDGNGNYILTEPGWYKANIETVSYYLDPRNFLTVEYILQFESLIYSEAYTETVVQSVLSSTYMAENSKLDNQSYASIFVEAGIKHNVSPVYLASLSRQETGVNGSIATTGEQFEYKGVNYRGLYNFYNIGAYSSEESPVRAGLVWASGGDTSVIVSSDNENSDASDNDDTSLVEPDDNNNDSSTDSGDSGNNEDSSLEDIVDEEPVEPEVVYQPVSYYLEKLSVKENNGYVYGFSLGMTVNQLISKKEDSTVIIYDKDGNCLDDNAKLKTGDKVSINNGKETFDYQVVIYGDVNGDGKVSASDYVLIKNYILKKNQLDGAYGIAADVSRSNNISASDYVLIKNHILGKLTISQI